MIGISTLPTTVQPGGSQRHSGSAAEVGARVNCHLWQVGWIGFPIRS